MRCRRKCDDGATNGERRLWGVPAHKKTAPACGRSARLAMEKDVPINPTSQTDRCQNKAADSIGAGHRAGQKGRPKGQAAVATCPSDYARTGHPGPIVVSGVGISSSQQKTDPRGQSRGSARSWDGRELFWKEGGHPDTFWRVAVAGESGEFLGTRAANINRHRPRLRDTSKCPAGAALPAVALVPPG